MDEKSKILIVEDDAVAARYIEKVVVNFGHRVIGIVETGQAAIYESRKLNPDLIIMDILLKGEMTGIEAAEAIFKFQDIPVVYLTAMDDQDTLFKARSTGPFGYVVKPFLERELELVVSGVLYRKKKEESIVDLEARHSFSLRYFNGISFIYNLDFHFQAIHGPFEKCFGYSVEDFLNGDVNLDMISHPDECPLFNDEIKVMFREVSNFQINKEYRIITKYGEIRWIRFFLKNVCDENGKPEKMLGLICDVSEYRDMYESFYNTIVEYDHVRKKVKGYCNALVEIKAEVDALRMQMGRPPKYSRLSSDDVE